MSIEPPMRLTADQLRLLATRMLHLRALRSAIALPPTGEALVFSPNLTKLQVDIEEVVSSEAINGMLQVASRLPLLREFAVWFFRELDPLISFAPFHSTPLTDICVCHREGGVYSDAQIDEFRAMPHLDSVNVSVEDDAAMLRRLLRTPHSLQWKSLGYMDFDAERAALLLSLPSLTSLSGRLKSVDPAFLLQLPNLTELNLDLAGAAATPEQQLTALQGCTKLTFLELIDCNFASQHMCALLPSLPALRKLTLYAGHQLESLRCFSRGPITKTLTFLALDYCRHPALDSLELDHVHALTELRSLSIDTSFLEPLDRFAQHQYSRPYSLLLPKLKWFHYYYEREDEE
jgi:hypothetical protein